MQGARFTPKRTRFRHPLTGLGDDGGEEEFEFPRDMPVDFTWAGPFTDYLHRAVAKRAGSSKAEEPLPAPGSTPYAAAPGHELSGSEPSSSSRASPKYARPRGSEAVIAEVLAMAKRKEQTLGSICFVAMSYERLQSTLSDLIMRRQGGSRNSSGLRLWRQHARTIMALSKHRLALGAEVGQSCARQAQSRAIEATESEANERQAEKEHRLRRFFHEFHEAARIPELGVTVMGESPKDGWVCPHWQYLQQPLHREKDFADAVVTMRKQHRKPGLAETVGEWTQPDAAATLASARSPRKGEHLAQMARQLRSGVHDGSQSARARGERHPGQTGATSSAQPPRSPAADEHGGVRLPSLTPCVQPLSREVEPKFSRPWLDKVSGDGSSTASRRYLRACEKLGVLPSWMPFVTGDSPRLTSCERIMTDNDLRAVMMVLKAIKHLEEIDLQDSSALTSASLVPLLEKIFKSPASTTLRRLSLKRCVQMGPETVDTVIQLLTSPEGAPQLRHLDLSGVKLTGGAQLELCNAIYSHPSLSSVCLEETGLGSSPQALSLIDLLMAASSVKDLRIGWNCFGADQLLHIGDSLTRHKNLRSLGLANGIATTRNKGKLTAARLSPIVLLLEQLCYEKVLTYLDISMNALDFRSALILEDALESNRCLRQMDVSNNPLGVLGMRYLLRLVSRRTNALERLIFDSCGGSATPQRAPSSGRQRSEIAPERLAFSTSCPGGRYTLDLADPSCRALLRMLYKCSERFQVPPDMVMTQVRYSRGSYAHPQKDPLGVWLVLRDGSLEVTFDIDPIVEKIVRRAKQSDLRTLTGIAQAAMRMEPCITKVVPILCMWRDLAGNEEDQKLFLNALSKDFVFSFPQVGEICSDGRIASEVVWRLLPSLPRSGPSRSLAMTCVPSLPKFCQLFRRLREHFTVNVDSPTWRYSLDLSSAVDQAVVQDLALLSRWETALAIKQEQPDISHLGDRSCFRNASFEGAALPARWVTEWPLADNGTLAFDYATGKRPPAGARAVDQELIEQAMSALQHSECDAHGRVGAMRAISQDIFCSASQLRALFAGVLDRQACMDLVVIFFFRITDIQNEKHFRVCFQPEEFRRIRHRLGHVAAFPFIQPEQETFELNLEDNDQRRAANLLATLAAQEDRAVLCERSFVQLANMDDGSLLENGVPRKWESIDEIPQSGSFRCRFAFLPKCRNLAFRSSLLERWGFQRAEESSISWRCGITEAPSAVFRVLEFLAVRCSGMQEAFDGLTQDKGELLTPATFEEGLRARLGLKKLSSEQINTVFRYLDVAANGQLSRVEWLACVQMWDEVRRCLGELDKAMRFKWGDDLRRAWFNLEADAQISRDIWDRCMKSSGYAGPDMFRFFDEESRGRFSEKRFFQVVKRFPEGVTWQE